MNESREDIINNCQNSYNRKIYLLENMAACIDLGLYRKKQEDAVMILTHPLLSDFKLLAIADGMGGLNYGDKASNFTLLEILKWFEKIPIEYYVKELPLYKEIINKIHEIDERIRKLYGNGGTTLSLAIITKNNTQFINVGDSRTYLLSNTGFYQISEDHSLVWSLFKEGKIAKDMMKFHKQNNLITSKIGGEKKNLIVNNNVFQNKDYDKIALFSDGVTDCVDDFTLKNIITNAMSLEEMAELIINKALQTTSINDNNLDSENFYDIINGGKDNASVALYKKIR